MHNRERSVARRRLLSIAGILSIVLVLPLAACSTSASRPTQTATLQPPSPTTSASTEEPLPGPSSTTEASTATPTTEPSATLTPDQAALIDELNETVFPLEGVEPTSGRADLAPLMDIIGDARIVGLGEATHGTHEFMMMSGRIVRMLIEEQGFKVLAFEAPWAQIEIVDQYVQGELDDPVIASQALFYWTIRTEEVWGLIEWLRAYNADLDPESRVHIAGFDPQANIEPAIELVLAYIEEVDPAAIEAISAQYTIVKDLSGARPALQEARTAYDSLATRRSEYSDASSPQAFDQALQTARVIVQEQELQVTYNESPPIDAQKANFILRDRFMADNVNWILEHAGTEARIVIWGHNGHIATCSLSPAVSYSDVTMMGAHLRAEHGTDYVAFGYDFANGSFITRTADSGLSREAHHKPEPLPTAYAYVFKELDAQAFVLDLTQDNPESLTGKWLNAEYGMWSVGSSFDPDDPYVYQASALLPECFDALIFFEETTASTVIEQ